MGNEFWTSNTSAENSWREISKFFENLRAGFIALALFVALIVTLAAAFIGSSRQEYIATIQMEVRPKQIIVDGPESLKLYQQFKVDIEQFETELGVLQSSDLLERVYQKLSIAENPEIIRSGGGFWLRVKEKINEVSTGAQTNTSYTAKFLEFKSRLRARRIGLSYIIDISYKSDSAQRAGKVVSAIALGYVLQRLNYVTASLKDNTTYFESRKERLTAEIVAAEKGMNTGKFPDITLSDSGVRLLGPAQVPSTAAYPRKGPFLIMASVLAVTVYLLLFMIRHENKGGFT
jgi:uncharacterized protein involved in exopolysaccharide biosynthesis